MPLIVKLLTNPETDGVITFAELFALTLTLVAVITGGGAVTVILSVATVDRPPGPTAVTPILSVPT